MFEALSPFAEAKHGSPLLASRQVLSMPLPLLSPCTASKTHHLIFARPLCLGLNLDHDWMIEDCKQLRHPCTDMSWPIHDADPDGVRTSSFVEMTLTRSFCFATICAALRVSFSWNPSFDTIGMAFDDLGGGSPNLCVTARVPGLRTCYSASFL